jgi:precorrin-3B synthase
MRTGDGLLVRLRLTGGVVPAPLARAIAGCAQNFGNGALDLSARANLHIRGVSDARLDPLTERLRELGLLDGDAESEAVRNVVASPMAGRDPAALLDIRELVRALEQRFTKEPALHRLPPKFCVTVEDGGSFGLAELASDIRFQAYRANDGLRFAIALGGTQGGAELVGACTPEAAPEAATALARAFLALRGSGPEAPRRMAALIERTGSEAIAARAKLEPAPADPPPQSGRCEPPLGFHPLGESGVFGAAAPFGRWMAHDLLRLADLADHYGNCELRLTIWRTILLPGVSPASASAVAVACADLATDPADPRLALVACPGAPACASATTPTRIDALALADAARGLAPRGVIVHVSGCAKGCARPAPAAVTLVGRNGLYDLVLAGTARDLPSRRELTAAQALDILDEMKMGTFCE